MDHLAFIFMLTTFEIIANVYFMFLCFYVLVVEVLKLLMWTKQNQ